VMAGLGHANVAVPQPINLFMDIPVAADGTLGWRPAPTRPGDSVTVRAEMDVLVVLSACPQDLNPINGPGPTALAMEVLGP
jgi:uncharacterized protein YcgI (DUF1989 family)